MSAGGKSDAVAKSLEILSECKTAVDDAERELEGALAGLEVVVRAQKTAVSAAIEQSLVRLREARVRMAEAEATLARESEGEGAK